LLKFIERRELLWIQTKIKAVRVRVCHRLQLKAERTIKVNRQRRQLKNHQLRRHPHRTLGHRKYLHHHQQKFLNQRRIPVKENLKLHKRKELQILSFIDS
jgi:hypothetical protein